MSGYEDPIATAIFAPDSELRALSEIEKYSLILRTVSNDRLTGAEFRRFARRMLNG